MTPHRRTAATLLGLVTTLLVPAPARAADPVRDAQWHLGYLNVTEAHTLSQGDGVTVAVVDTGVDAGHPDLAGSVLPGTDLTFEGPGDGRTDSGGHGTGVAGLIAAHGRALGIAPKAKVQSVRVTPQALASGSSHDGIAWAIDRGSTVFCVARAEPDAPDLHEVVDRALAADIVVVAGVGNRPLHSEMQYPAGYPGVIAAAGIDQNGQHADLSVTGPEVVLAAPAVDIATTDIRSGSHTGYATADGTSAATAIIAGAAALVRAKYPNLSAAEVVHRLTATADDKGPPGRDDQYGYGVVNLVRALTADVPPLQPTSQPAPPSQSPTAASPPTDNSGVSPALTFGGVALLLLLAAALATWRYRRAR